MNLRRKELTDVLTCKGLDSVAKGHKLCVCVYVNKDKVSGCLDQDYLLKLDGRKLESFLQTLYQVNGQVNTQVMKLIHINAFVDELIEEGYFYKDIFEELFPKACAKMEYLSDKKLNTFLNSGEDLKEWLVIHYKGAVSLITKDMFKDVVEDVNSGCWEKVEVSKKYKGKQAVKQLFYTKGHDEDSKVVLVCKDTGEFFTVFPSKNFNHRKFSDMHRGVSFEDMKSLVGQKFHTEKDAEWFKQFEL